MNDISNHTSSIATSTNSKNCLYIHIPFCPSGCKFCHFYLPWAKKLGYINLLEREIILRFPKWKTHVDTIHIGGWTPNMLSDSELTALFDLIQRKFVWWQELSIELHTELLSYKQLDTLKKWWVTRISFWIQTFDTQILQAHARISKNYEKLWLYIEYAKKIGFQKLNFDLIYDLLGDWIKNIENNLAFISKYRPTSVNYYWLRLLTDYLRKNHTINYRRRFAFYLKIREWLTKLWYIQKNDAIYHLPWFQGGKNFLYEDYVYAHNHTLYGIGVAATSHTANWFHKNVISLDTYEKLLSEERIPQDLHFRLEEIPFLLYRCYYWLLMYKELDIPTFEKEYWGGSIEKMRQHLARIEQEGLIIRWENSLRLSEKWTFYLSILEDLLMRDYQKELELLRKL